MIDVKGYERLFSNPKRGNQALHDKSESLSLDSTQSMRACLTRRLRCRSVSLLVGTRRVTWQAALLATREPVACLGRRCGRRVNGLYAPGGRQENPSTLTVSRAKHKALMLQTPAGFIDLRVQILPIENFTQQ